MTETTSLSGGVSPALTVATTLQASNTNGFTVDFTGKFATMGTTPAQIVPTMTFTPSLQGTSPTMAISSVAGYAGLGQIGVALSNSTANVNTVGGSLILITFDINANAPGGSTPINLMGTNSPGGMLTVTTDLDDANGGSIPLRPVPTNGSDAGVDGLVTIAAPHFVVSAPTSATKGVPFQFTVTAEDSAGNVNTTYSGTVTFTSSDPNFTPIPNTTLSGGTGHFSATLGTVGCQTITAADTVNTNLKNVSGPIEVNAVGAHFVISAPTSVAQNSPFFITVSYEDGTGTVIPTYSGIVHFTSNDPLAVLPGDTTLANGVGTLPVTLKTIGTETIVATDTLVSTVTGSTAVTSHFRCGCPVCGHRAGHQHGGPGVHGRRDRPGFWRPHGDNLHGNRPLYVFGSGHRGCAAAGLHVHRGRPGRAYVFNWRDSDHRRHSDRGSRRHQYDHRHRQRHRHGDCRGRGDLYGVRQQYRHCGKCGPRHGDGPGFVRQRCHRVHRHGSRDQH